MSKKKKKPNGLVYQWVDEFGEMQRHDIRFSDDDGQLADADVQKVDAVSPVVTVVFREPGVWPLAVGAIQGQSFGWSVTNAGAVSFSWDEEVRLIIAPGMWSTVVLAKGRALWERPTT